jgi:hypothetical protein
MPLLHIATTYAINLIETVEIKMTTFQIGDTVTTIDAFPTVGVIKEFGFIPHSNNKHAFIENEKFKDSLIAIDLTWIEIKKL